MPEGDTIFRAAGTLQRALGGQAVTTFETVLPMLARVDDDRPIAGRVVERVWARGKHLLMLFSGDLVLRTHMRMNGSWHVYKPGERWRRPRRDMRIVIGNARYVAVAFTVPEAEFLDARTLEHRSRVAALGPDLLADDCDLAEAERRVRVHPDRTIADVLLDQRVVAGIGNVFKSETCFVAGVNPFAPVSALEDTMLHRVLETARRLMRSNVTETSGSGIVTYRGMRQTTGRADPSARLWVYGRRGKPCRRCGTPIESRKQGIDARSTYWCPRCQSGTLLMA